MAISFNTGTTADGGAGFIASLNITVPAGVLAGDVVFIVFASNKSSGAAETWQTSSTGTAPTIIGTSQSTSFSGFEMNAALFYFVANATDAGKVVTGSFVSGGTAQLVAAMAAYTGASSPAPIDVSGVTTATGAGASVTCPSEVTNVANDWDLQIIGASLAGSSYSGPSSGFTSRESISDASSGATAAIWDSNASVGAAGTTIGGGTFTNPGHNSQWAGWTIGLAPATVASPPQMPQRQRFKKVQTLQFPTPAPPAVVTVPPPPQLPPIRRRTPARAYWRGSAPFLGYVAVPAPLQQPGPAPRRKPARVLWHGITGSAYVFVPAPHQEPYLPPRRRPARAYWRGSAPFLGYVFVPAPAQQPRQLPRRRLARAFIQFTPVRTTNGTGAQVPGSLQPWPTVPIPRRRSRQRAFIQFTPVRTTNPPQILPPSGVVLFAQGAPGGDRPPEIRMFRSIMPGEIPAAGSQLPKLHGRGYAAPPPTRADDVEVLWEAPPEPAEPPGPTPAEIVLGEAQRAAGALYDLGRILAPEPYVPPSKAKCSAIRKLGTETLRCVKKRGHPGMHSDRGVRWG